MNAALVVDNKKTVLAAGMGKHCHLFALRYKLSEENSEKQEKGAASSNGDLRHRKNEGEGKSDDSDRKEQNKSERNGYVNHKGERR